MADCVVKDISITGALVIVAVPEIIPDYFKLDFGDKKVQPKCRVRWRRDNEMGVEFYLSR